MQTVLKKRQLVTYENGAKAMMVFKPHRTTAVIEFYVPTSKYMKDMEVRKYRIEQLEERKRKRSPVCNLKFHQTIARKLFMNLVAAGIMNPNLDDVWMAIDYTTPEIPKEAVDKYKKEILNTKVSWSDATLG